MDPNETVRKAGSPSGRTTVTGDDASPVRLPGQRPPGGFVAVAAALAVLALVGALILAFFGGRKTEVTVPALVGLTVDQAAAAAQAAGLGLLAENGDLRDTPRVLVAAQNPTAGAPARAGSTVHIRLGVPLAPVAVPDLVGLSEAAAREALRAVGLVLGALREDFKGAPPGTVTRQDPPPGGTVPPGSAVDMWVAAAARTPVPDFLGLSRARAEAAAAAAGLDLRVLSEVTDEVAPDTVFEQSPQAGSRVEPGAQVVVVVNAAAGPGDTASGASAAGGVPAVYAALAKVYAFPVLYPTYLPAGLDLVPPPDNPRQVTGPAGEQGFSVEYADPQRPGVRLALLEGDWFDTGLEDATTVDVHGTAAALGRVGDTVRIIWREGATAYGLSAAGLSDDEAVRFADGLRPVDNF